MRSTESAGFQSPHSDAIEPRAPHRFGIHELLRSGPGEQNAQKGSGTCGGVGTLHLVGDPRNEVPVYSCPLIRERIDPKWEYFDVDVE